VEPYPWNTDGLGQQTLLGDIASGRYDPVIEDIARTVHAFEPAPVYLRFGHELDLTGHYPWSRANPAAFIAAYRHFVERVRASTANAQFIWSPSGGLDSEKYYPGSDVVDSIGVTMLATEEWLGSEELPSFASMMVRSSVLASELGKPFIVCELGVSRRDSAAKQRWVTEARSNLDRFPQLAGVVYFDDRQPESLVPDWRLTPAELDTFFALPRGGP
jgi:beta-mannanase